MIRSVVPRTAKIRRILITALTALTLSAPALAQSPDDSVPGLVVRPSDAGVHETAIRFAEQARISGMTVYTRIDHRQGAMSRSMALLPTEVIIFGNPKSTTPLMQCAPTAGIDLPLKALVWQDGDGQTWLGYNDPAWIAERHHGSDCPAVKPLQQEIEKVVTATLQE